MDYLERVLSSKTFWERPYVDPWSLAHFLSGALIAYALWALGLEFWTSAGVSISVAILWELFEKWTRLSATEYFTNNLTDIFFAQAGFLIFWFVYRGLRPARAFETAFVLLACFITIALIGWISYTYYRGG